MRTTRTADPRVCSIDAALKVIGEKWALLALREIALGQHRFDDIVFNTGAPRDVLATRLKTLEAAGVVRRQLYQERPARHEYHLSEAGEQLFGVLHAIRDWGDRFARDDPQNIATFSHSCGAKLHVEIRCAACGEPVVPGDVAADRHVHRSDLVCVEG
ncbi:winged helix-turn-helix transcriptional regulator (plasmid) [Rhizobium leguminosarum]